LCSIDTYPLQYVSMPFSDKTILKSIKNPSSLPYEVVIETEEITFLGGEDKPDFGRIKITMYPGRSIIELKSLKYYFYDFRNRRVSYERIANTIYDDLEEVYGPSKLRVVMEFSPRGGISSTLTVDSDIRSACGDSVAMAYTRTI